MPGVRMVRRALAGGEVSTLSVPGRLYDTWRPSYNRSTSHVGLATSAAQVSEGICCCIFRGGWKSSPVGEGGGRSVIHYYYTDACCPAHMTLTPRFLHSTTSPRDISVLITRLHHRVSSPPASKHCRAVFFSRTHPHLKRWPDGWRPTSSPPLVRLA
ncbi:hypothetical protein B296_00056010 [Ensete ventricosum]|uniref:Uncharacterized protein n=1 Tax=Ensete ventricosum TaxID=4639 RepID=A0A426WYD0_ENSVE|nr:hypothetical protein B296_00056010 [Ensete ventricosum]